MARNRLSSKPSSDDNLGAACGRLLAALPGPDQEPIAIDDVVHHLQPGDGVAAEAVIAMFERLGILHRPLSGFVQAVSHDAGTLLHVLGEYLRAGLPLLGDWRASGLNPDVRRRRDLIGLLEKYRVEEQGEKAPASRQVRAVAAIIKGRLGNEQVYLTQENPTWLMQWWVGGIVEKKDGSLEEALYREIREELDLARPAIKSMRYFTEIVYQRMSERVKAKTEYHTSFFDVTLDASVVPRERFHETNQVDTTTRDGRGIRRQNQWLTWERFCSQARFETKAADIAAILVSRGIAGLAAPHAVLASGRSEDDQPLETNSQIAAMIAELDRIVLSECVVVGKYLKHNEVVRNDLKDRARQIMEPLRKKSLGEMNFLIWAASGSGKSYFVQQICEQLKTELGSQFEYVECNLARDTREEFTRKVEHVASRSGPVLCLLDEIDSLADQDWPYEVCFAKLELNKNPDKRVVFVLVGSTKSNLGEMVEAMKKRHKGPDLLNRILETHHHFSIPPSSPADVAAMVVGRIADLIGGRVTGVEKLALYYILCNSTLRSSPKQLRMFIENAADRFGTHDDRLRYHHLFRPEDSEKLIEFRVENAALVGPLVGQDIRITR